MIIRVSFLNGSRYWRDKVTANADQASRILSDPAFIAKVRAWPMFDFTADTPAQVADKIECAGIVTIKVGFYWRPFFTKAIAYEEDGQVWFNTAKERYGAGGLGNTAHEVIHALNYSHNGNSPAGQANTVPWRIGEWVSNWHLERSRSDSTIAAIKGVSVETQA